MNSGQNQQNYKFGGNFGLEVSSEPASITKNVSLTHNFIFRNTFSKPRSTKLLKY